MNNVLNMLVFFLQIIRLQNTAISMHFNQSGGGDTASMVWHTFYLPAAYICTVSPYMAWVWLIYVTMENRQFVAQAGYGLGPGASGKAQSRLICGLTPCVQKGNENIVLLFTFYILVVRYLYLLYCIVFNLLMLNICVLDLYLWAAP